MLTLKETIHETELVSAITPLIRESSSTIVSRLHPAAMYHQLTCRRESDSSFKALFQNAGVSPELPGAGRNARYSQNSNSGNTGFWHPGPLDSSGRTGDLRTPGRPAPIFHPGMIRGVIIECLTTDALLTTCPGGQNNSWISRYPKSTSGNGRPAGPGR